MTKLSKEEARKLFDDFSKSKFQLNQWCARNNFSQASFRKVMKKHFPDEWEDAIKSKKPKSTRYKLGRSLEYGVRDKLRSLGFFVVRSAQSKTIVDLVGLKRDNVVLVQCKRGGALPSSEWNELYELAEKVGARALFAERSTGVGINIWILRGNFASKSIEKFEA